MTENTLYITGAGVSAESGIPTFRGNDGFWTIGSVITPQEMATRHMYQNNPEEFLCGTLKDLHHIEMSCQIKSIIFYQIKDLSHKTLTAWTVSRKQRLYSIHGRLDKALVYDEMDHFLKLTDAPWDEVDVLTDRDNNAIKMKLLDAFKISKETKKPELGKSLRPFILLFDEYYTDQYRMSEAESWMKMPITIYLWVHPSV